MRHVYYLVIEGHKSVIATTFNQKSGVKPEKLTDWADSKYWEVMKTSPLPYYPTATVVAVSGSELEYRAFTRPQDSNMAGHSVWQAPTDQNVIDKLIAFHKSQQQG